MKKNLERILKIFCSTTFLMVATVSFSPMVKAAEVTINEVNFPDEGFRNYVKTNIDKDGNGILSDDEINTTKDITAFTNSNVNNLDGIGYFTELTSLSYAGENLTKLDISKNVKLKYLYCAAKNLLELDISNNIALTELHLERSSITKLDLSKNTALTNLELNGNNLTELDISANIALTNLRIMKTGITKLDTSNNTKLIKIDCYRNKLTELCLDKNMELTDLSCRSNNITRLDIDKNTSLKNLDCGSNELEKLDVSKNIELTGLSCHHNNLTELDVRQNIKLTYLECGSNNISKLDISNNVMLERLYCGYNNLNELNISNNKELKYLTCSSNNISELNLSNNILLIDVECYHNKLEELDVSNNISLENLNCNRNQIKELDVSKNLALQGLFYNQHNDIILKLNDKAYNSLYLYVENADEAMDDDVHITLDNFSNIAVKEITANDDEFGAYTFNVLEVIDKTKQATYDYCWSNNANLKYTCTIIYGNAGALPENDFIFANCNNLFYDYDYTKPISGSAVVIYGNGTNQIINGIKTNNKLFVAYTDILASYNYTINSKGIVKPSIGKVIVGITKSNTKPVVNKNKIVDAEAAKIAKAKIKNGMITVTATGKEKGVVYLWVIDTGNKNVYECCPINVQMAPRRLEVKNTSGNKLKNSNIENGKTLDVNIVGITFGDVETMDCTYTATVSPKYQNYIEVTPVSGSTSQFTIKATGLQNNKNTKAVVTFKCEQNGKKVNFSVTITK